MISPLFHPFVGGAEKECQKLSKNLKEKGISVTVLTQHSDVLPEYEKIEGIPVYRKIRGWHLFEYTYMLSVFWFLIRNIRRFDIIQCFGLYLFIPPVVLIKYLFGKKVIARVEGPGYYGDFQRIKKLKFGDLILQSARKTDKIIAISRDIYREISENNFPKQNIVSIPNSVDVEFFHPQKSRRNRKLKKIAFVGRLEQEKGLEYLINAMKMVKTEWEGVKLFIIGDGQLRNNLEELRQKLGLVDDIIFVGHTNNALSYYQEADLFVLPSLSEGLSLSLLEAMSCALPVVATKVGGNVEVVDSDLEAGKSIVSDYHIGENGILVNPKDVKGLAEALLRLLKDESLSRILGRNARQRVIEKFSLDGVSDQYLGLYQQLILTTS